MSKNIDIKQEDLDLAVSEIREHVLCDKDVLDDAFEEIPEIIIDELKKDPKDRKIIEAAEKRFVKKVEREAKAVMKHQLKLEKRSIVHCTEDSFKELLEKHKDDEKYYQHLVRMQKIWMPLLDGYFKGMFENFMERFDVRLVQKYEEVTEEKRKELKAKGVKDIGKEAPMYNPDGTPIMEEKLVLYAENLGTEKYYMLYLAEIVERLLKKNVESYTKRITKK